MKLHLSRKSTDAGAMSAHSPVAPSRQETLASNASEDAVPDVDPNSVSLRETLRGTTY